jgi:hypothetical protein
MMVSVIVSPSFSTTTVSTTISFSGAAGWQAAKAMAAITNKASTKIIFFIFLTPPSKYVSMFFYMERHNRVESFSYFFPGTTSFRNSTVNALICCDESLLSQKIFGIISCGYP